MPGMSKRLARVMTSERSVGSSQPQAFSMPSAPVRGHSGHSSDLRKAERAVEIATTFSSSSVVVAVRRRI